MNNSAPLVFQSRIAAAEMDQDRIAIFQNGAITIFALADGAGGRSGGAEAANKTVTDLIQSFSSLKSLPSVKDCVKALEQLDVALYRDKHCGETTAVLVVEAKGKVVGASVGDSGAWRVSSQGFLDLTKSQRRKPFLGSGAAQPRSFGPLDLGQGRLLIASDGLFKYSDWSAIREVLMNSSFDECLAKLIEPCQMKSGRLQDDLALIVAERRAAG
ncbi:MAG: protein phosphatase 2C domain-containing protein [Planctomycetota bacterium]|nr:protein phosphatase 2C domain-containing protein [Planctomycetota bacterium]